MAQFFWKKTAEHLRMFFVPCWENSFRAPILSSNFLVYYLIFIILLKLIVVPIILYFPQSELFAAISKTLLIEMTNNQRERIGLAPLKENKELDKAALYKAQDMIEKGYFSHTSPDGTSPWHWFSQTEYDYRKAGENLAIGFVDTEEVFKAWYASPSHKANIVNPDYKDIGMAIIKGNFNGNETTMVVQLFGTPQGKAAPIVKPIPPAEPAPGVTAAPVPEEEPAPETKIPGKPEKTVSNPKPLEQKKKLKETPTVAPAATSKPAKAEESFWKFMNTNYFNVIQGIILASVVVIILVLSATIFSAIEVHPNDLLFKAVFFIFVFSLFILLDKDAIVNLIPHVMNING